MSTKERYERVRAEVDLACEKACLLYTSRCV